MPNHRAEKRWDHPTYRYAYVREHRGMACTVIHGSYPLSTGLYWKSSSKARAMSILEERLRVFLMGLPAPSVRRGSTCEEIFDAYLTARRERMSKNAVWEYTRYMTAFCPVGVDARNTHALRAEIMRRVKESTYAPNSKRQGLKRLRAVFEFGVSEGMITVNPVHRDMLPPEAPVQITPYTDAEIDALINGLDGRPRLFVEFLASSGCRAVEAVRLQWPDVKSDHVVIDGKRNKRDAPKKRIVPFALCPELPDVLQRTRNSPLAGTVSVFGLNNYQSVARAMSRVLDDARGFHDIRKWRINKWVRAGWPERVIEAVAGHDSDISKKHYRTPYTAAELARFVQGSEGK